MPDDAPVLRLAARVLLIDAANRILLLRWKLEDGDIWILPGGGLNEGETFEAAAIRELWEETGIGDVDLGPCVWMRAHLFPWDGKVYKQQERFYPVLVDQAEVTDQYWDENERKVLAEFKWWSMTEIQASDAFFAPPSLHELLPAILAGDYPAEPIAIPF